MKIISGNILDIKHGIICHQVNCKGVMGAGLAMQIRKKWPSAYNDYYIAFKKGLLLLGNIVTSKINQNLYVAHLCGQNEYGRTPGKIYTDYNALASCMTKVVVHDNTIYIPYGIGCGLAGGNWKIVSDMIKKYMPDSIVVKFNQKGE